MCGIVFVILHYITLDDTIECVESIRNKCGKEKYKIVIVDNASPNASGLKLQKRYGEVNDIDLVLLHNNLGFAKGNNAGIDVARKKYAPDFIAVMNNDVMLLQEDTISIIREEYSKSKFSVLGPMIYTADGRCDDNPGRSSLMSIDEIDNVISENRKSIFLCKWHLWKVYRLLEAMKKKILHTKDENVRIKSSTHKKYLEKAENVQLHGCFLCFSRNYFEHYNGFFPKTFLYMEEDILFYLTRKENMTTVYTPDLKIYHKEDSASKAKWISDKERAVKKAQFVLESAIEFKNIRTDSL